VDHGAQYPNPLDRSQGGRRPKCPAWPRTRGAAHFTRQGSARARLITRDFRLPRPPRRPDFARSASVVYVFVHLGIGNREPETFRGARSLDAPNPRASRQFASTPATVGQALGHATALAHSERPLRAQRAVQIWVAKARTRRAKREHPGCEARAFTLNRSARLFRARPSVSRGLRPLMGSRECWAGFERLDGSRSQKRAGQPLVARSEQGSRSPNGAGLASWAPSLAAIETPIGHAASRLPDRVDEARHRRWPRGSRDDEHGGAIAEGLRSAWQVSIRRRS
jgi:hypothetical protein